MRTISHADSKIGPVSEPPTPPHYLTKKIYAAVYVTFASKLCAADLEPNIRALVCQRLKIKKNIYRNKNRATHQHFPPAEGKHLTVLRCCFTAENQAGAGTYLKTMVCQCIAWLVAGRALITINVKIALKNKNKEVIE